MILIVSDSNWKEGDDTEGTFAKSQPSGMIGRRLICIRRYIAAR